MARAERKRSRHDAPSTEWKALAQGRVGAQVKNN